MNHHASLKIVTSQLKIVPTMTDAEISVYEITQASTLRNEPFSFQILYRSALEIQWQPVSISIEADGLPASAWRVDFVPILRAAADYNILRTAVDKNTREYVSVLPGLYPDPLLPRPLAPEIIEKGGLYFEKDVENLLNSYGENYQAVFVTVNPNSEAIEAGKYRIKVKMTELNQLTLIGEAVMELEVIDALLAEQVEYYTNWFHVDSLCKTHAVEPYTEAFYRIFRSYIKNAVQNRMNTLLLPAFTPPLDTPIGCTRMNVQLVDISKTAGTWVFGFEKLRRFIREADACGIRVFEHCQLFSQWGAAHAPNIYDTDGVLLFGWDTDASSDEYCSFIRAYLTAFLDFVADEGLTPDRFVFHISDEPSMEQLESYKKAYNTVADILSDYNMIDALFDVSFWKSGLVKQPVVYITRAETFENVCPSFWLYYTGARRLITSTAARIRALGLQMYRYRAAGFLHWSYNFYFDRMSEGFFDPRCNPCGYKLGPGGSYLVYPGKDCVIPSMRETEMREAFDDLRALKLLEKQIGRDAVLSFCEEILGEKVDTALIPEGNDLFTLREKINRKIAENTK